jgi:hypothetical protein
MAALATLGTNKRGGLEMDFEDLPQYNTKPQYGEAIKYFEETLLCLTLAETDRMVRDIQSGNLRPWDRLDRMRRIIETHDQRHQWFMHFMGHAEAPVEETQP